MKKWHVELAVWIASGIGLLYGTKYVLRDVGDQSLRGSAGWLSLVPSMDGLVGGQLLLVTLVYVVIVMWLLLFLLWVIRKALHIKSPDRTTRLS